MNRTSARVSLKSRLSPRALRGGSSARFDATRSNLYTGMHGACFPLGITREQARREGILSMSDAQNDPKPPLEDIAVDLDDEQLAQIDALIEQHSTAEHRLTRAEVTHLLLENGAELVSQGESLSPYLKAADKDESAKKR